MGQVYSDPFWTFVGIIYIGSPRELVQLKSHLLSFSHTYSVTYAGTLQVWDAI